MEKNYDKALKKQLLYLSKNPKTPEQYFIQHFKIDSDLYITMFNEGGLVKYYYDDTNDKQLISLSSGGIKLLLSLKEDKEEKKEPLFEGKSSFKLIGTFNWLEALRRLNKRVKLPIKIILILIILLLIIFIYFTFKNKPSFSYSMMGRTFSPENSASNEFPMVMEFWYDGTVRNTFDKKMTLERIDYVFWKNKKIGSTYGGGFSMGDIYDLGVDEERKKLKLPILFEENEAKHLGISFGVNIENETELKDKFQHVCTGVFCHWETNVELNFKDSKGNIFDEEGKLISREVIDSWWLLPNNKTKKDSLLAKLDIYKDIAIWKIRRWFYLY